MSPRQSARHVHPAARTDHDADLIQQEALPQHVQPHKLNTCAQPQHEQTQPAKR